MTPTGRKHLVHRAGKACRRQGQSSLRSTANALGETTPTMLETLGLTYDDLGYIGALKGSDGTCKYMRTEAINFVTVILRGSENAADAVNWINLKQQNQLYINIGVEGTHFNYDEDGGIAPINPIFVEERGNSYWYLDSTNEEEFAPNGRPASANPTPNGRFRSCYFVCQRKIRLKFL